MRFQITLKNQTLNFQVQVLFLKYFLNRQSVIGKKLYAQRSFLIFNFSPIVKVLSIYNIDTLQQLKININNNIDFEVKVPHQASQIMSAIQSDFVRPQQNKCYPPTVQRKSNDFNSCSSKSDKFVSASKSVKAFQDSLRKYDLAVNKTDEFFSPLKEKLFYDQNQSNHIKTMYIVDTQKKIKKVQSPFSEKFCPQIDGKKQCRQPQQQYNQLNKLNLPFQAISQKNEEQIDSSSELQKVIFSCVNEESMFKDIEVKYDNVIQKNQNEIQLQMIKTSEQMDIEASNNKENLASDFHKGEQISVNQNIVKCSGEQQGSLKSYSLNNSSSQNSFRLKLKHRKRMIRKEKRKNAKAIKHKLDGIGQFLNQLYQKQHSQNRKELVQELKSHLCEKKFGKLRNELKRLI